MAAIELDDQTAKELLDAAQSLGVSVDALVRSRVLGKSSVAAKPATTEIDFDAELDALAISAPPLPADFSRADIYPDDH